MKKLEKSKKESTKLAAISAIWIAVIIATSILLGDTEQFVQLLPLLCVGGFLSVGIEIFTQK